MTPSYTALVATNQASAVEYKTMASYRTNPLSPTDAPKPLSPDAKLLLQFLSADPGGRLSFVRGTPSWKAAGELVGAGAVRCQGFRRGPVHGVTITLPEGRA